MANLSCPSQDLNFLSPNGFQLSIERLPRVSFFTQQVSLPGVTLQALEQQTPLVRIEIPSDQLQFEQLQLQFAVDEKMDNWIEVFNWMQGLTFPQDYDQYRAEQSKRSFLSKESADLPKNYSDAALIVLNSHNNASRVFKFIDCFPTQLGGIQFSSTNTDVQYATASLTLEYTYFTIS
jgi:hypothetical protein